MSGREVEAQGGAARSLARIRRSVGASAGPLLSRVAASMCQRECHLSVSVSVPASLSVSSLSVSSVSTSVGGVSVSVKCQCRYHARQERARQILDSKPRSNVGFLGGITAWGGSTVCVRVCVCVCVRARARACVCVRERKRERGWPPVLWVQVWLHEQLPCGATTDRPG